MRPRKCAALKTFDFYRKLWTGEHKTDSAHKATSRSAQKYRGHCISETNIQHLEYLISVNHKKHETNIDLLMAKFP